MVRFSTCSSLSDPSLNLTLHTYCSHIYFTVNMPAPSTIPDFYSGACFVVPEGVYPAGLENRAPFLPRPYIVPNHVLVRQPHVHGVIYVYKEDTRNEARMRSIRKHVKTLNIPKGSPERLRQDFGTFITCVFTIFSF